MIFIQKGNAPQALSNARRRLKTTPGARVNYDSLTGKEKDDIKAALLKEQGYLCAYCMRRIGLQNSSIEHYLVRHPSEKYRSNMKRFIEDGSFSSSFNPNYDADKESLDYENLLAVCPGGEGGPENSLTCDKARNTHANMDKPLRVSPLSEHSMREIDYSSDGRILSRDERHNGAAAHADAISEDLNVVLNLNCPALVRSRRAVVRGLEKELKRRFPTAGHREAVQHYCRKRLQNIQSGQEKPEYAGILMWKLRKLAK